MGMHQSLASPESGSLSQLRLSRPPSHRVNEPGINCALSQVSAPVGAGCELTTHSRAGTLAPLYSAAGLLFTSSQGILLQA
jgi:hypothetical protein